MTEVSSSDFINEEFSASFLLSSASAIMGLTSTVVLAAGWHTIAWSVMNLFIPMLFSFILPVMILSAIGLQNYDVKKKKENLDKAYKETVGYIEKILVPLLADRASTELNSLSKLKRGRFSAANFRDLKMPVPPLLIPQLWNFRPS